MGAADPFSSVIDWEQPVYPQIRRIVYGQLLARETEGGALPRHLLVSQRVLNAIVREYLILSHDSPEGWLLEPSKKVWYFAMLKLVVCPDCDIYVPSAVDAL